jgi:hypothetical protein
VRRDASVGRVLVLGGLLPGRPVGPQGGGRALERLLAGDRVPLGRVRQQLAEPPHRRVQPVVAQPIGQRVEVSGG